MFCVLLPEQGKCATSLSGYKVNSRLRADSNGRLRSRVRVATGCDHRPKDETKLKLRRDCENRFRLTGHFRSASVAGRCGQIRLEAMAKVSSFTRSLHLKHARRFLGSRERSQRRIVRLAHHVGDKIIRSVGQQRITEKIMIRHAASFTDKPTRE